jgi:hypothetical protein
MHDIRARDYYGADLDAFEKQQAAAAEGKDEKGRMQVLQGALQVLRGAPV